MRNLKTIEKKVRAVLEKNEDARNDDMVLYLALCNACLKDAGAMPLAEIMTQHKYLGLPSFESVSRTRRKLQARYPELAGSRPVQKREPRARKPIGVMPKNREVLMDEEKRSNQNYEIIESCTIGSTELVIGHNPNSPNPYVCWYCKGGSNYFWGYYTNELDDARQKLNERYQSECRMPYNQPAQKQKNGDDRER